MLRAHAEPLEKVAQLIRVEPTILADVFVMRLAAHRGQHVRLELPIRAVVVIDGVGHAYRVTKWIMSPLRPRNKTPAIANSQSRSALTRHNPRAPIFGSTKATSALTICAQP